MLWTSKTNFLYLIQQIIRSKKLQESGWWINHEQDVMVVVKNQTWCSGGVPLTGSLKTDWIWPTINTETSLCWRMHSWLQLIHITFSNSSKQLVVSGVQSTQGVCDSGGEAGFLFDQTVRFLLLHNSVSPRKTLNHMLLAAWQHRHQYGANGCRFAVAGTVKTHSLSAPYLPS